MAREYSKSPTYKPSSCELSKMRTCVCTSSHISQSMCLVYTVTCVHPLQVVVLLCTLLYSTLQSTVVPYLYFKSRMSSMTRKKELLPRHHWFIFFKRVDRIESSKKPEPVPSTSGVSELAACPLSPIAGDPSALPSPTSSPRSSQQLFLPVHSMPAPVCQLLYCTTVLFKVLYCEIKSVFLYFLCLLFIYYLCEKYYKPITVQYYIANCVSWVPRLTLLDLRTCSQDRTRSYVGDLLQLPLRLSFIQMLHNG